MDEWRIVTAQTGREDRAQVLKHEDTFALFDRYGDIQDGGEQGLYHEGTRFLSKLELLLNGHRPLFLNSTLRHDSGMLAVDLTNPDSRHSSGLFLPKGTLHLFRGLLLWNGAVYQHLRVTNHGLHDMEATLSFIFAADYIDIFEARGFKRTQRGKLAPAQVNGAELTLSYLGLDAEQRTTRFVFSPAPLQTDDQRAQFSIKLEPQQSEHIYLRIRCGSGKEERPIADYSDAFAKSSRALQGKIEAGCAIVTSGERLNQWLERAYSDLAMLLTDTREGMYPYAGVPWFSCPFGRDGIITALECLWVNPQIAKGVLQFLATHQADAELPEQDAEPGKILHETRKGELAHLKEIPFGCYYGSVDSTPLFVVLAGAYFERTGDMECIEQLWPHLMRALERIDRYGDVDGDGFVEYSRRAEKGLVHQGWKDSEDAISHEDGMLAEGPIALCEVQGYVYQAKLSAARLAQARGLEKEAQGWRDQAAALRARFEAAFWCEEIGSYALALDGAKRPCRVRASNAGHALFSGIASPERARRVAGILLTEDCFSGWGIRTLATGAVRYNPMSYHNGSIWPHDNGLIAAGFARYGLAAEAQKVFAALFEASAFMELHRLPELFCGFDRRSGESPVIYPVACAPQAWASAAVFCLVQAALGLSFSPEEPRIRLVNPTLPEFCDWMRITNLSVPGAVVDLHLKRHLRDVSVNVIRKEGNVEVAVLH
jgi:glycogen debranching enzyme